MKFLEVTSVLRMNGDKQVETLVNPANVLTISKSESGFTKVEFHNGYYIFVKESLKDLNEKLEGL